MKVSVVVSTYNRPEYLEVALRGYLNQTIMPHEIIIADDGSTDETKAVIEKFRDLGLNLIHCWHEDRGFRLSVIRNKAVAMSSGEYLLFTDDDILPSKRLVEDHILYAEEGYFLQGHRVLLGPEATEVALKNSFKPRSLLRMYLRGQIRNLSNSFRLPIFIVKKSMSLKGIRGCNFSLFKKDFIAVNGFNEEFQGWGKEDSELAIRLYRYGLRRKDLKFKAVCFHLYHPLHDRSRLAENLQLLERTSRSRDYYCKNGIDKYLLEV